MSKFRNTHREQVPLSCSKGQTNSATDHNIFLLIFLSENLILCSSNIPSFTPKGYKPFACTLLPDKGICIKMGFVFCAYKHNFWTAFVGYGFGCYGSAWSVLVLCLIAFLSYCIYVHKSKGTQGPLVFILGGLLPLDKNHSWKLHATFPTSRFCLV